MKLQLILLTAVGLLAAGCNTATAANTTHETAYTDGQLSTCLVTLPPKTAFIPPEPWPLFRLLRISSGMVNQVSGLPYPGMAAGVSSPLGRSSGGGARVSTSLKMRPQNLW